ncbi:hypothetical protein CaldiYA01_22540 [Caldicellulosiruptor diazotrophicus]|uniref:Uncharacterized protein n=1 Tax=Caldicellulosiruptor diazotrophicus TaxID=2806205 RepID=A0ABN6EEX8_9FIRM|nr:hypothetical protein CaldiYA01_22540 [Caldicellulosiruptor diazotrophicus]
MKKLAEEKCGLKIPHILSIYLLSLIPLKSRSLNIIKPLFNQIFFVSIRMIATTVINEIALANFLCF